MRGIVIFLVACLVAATSADGQCARNTHLACSTGSDLQCNAVYGNGFLTHIQPELQAFANANLKHSYDYLLLSSYFNNYQKARPGFRKVFRELSDKLWEDTINLIKHITKRGGSMDFSKQVNEHVNIHRNDKIELNEIAAMAYAVDTEKELASISNHIHDLASRKEHHEPEIASYLEERFMEKQAEDIRKLSGYTNDLKNLYSPNNLADNSLATYLFDEYLTKV